MKSFYKTAVIATLFSILTACGNSSETSSNSTNPVAANTSANQVTVAENKIPTAVNQPNDTKTVAEQKSLERRLEVSGENSNSNVQVITISPNEITTKNPATTLGDGSEVSTVLGAKGAVETRTFKNNPQLAKLERTTDGKNVSIKVYLKNGKVIPVAKEKIQNFTNDSAEQILRAVGVEPKPAPQSNAPKEKTYTFTFPVKPSN